MNTKTKNFVWVLALSGALILPACGKNEVKSEKIPETNLKSSTNSAQPAVTATVSPNQTATTMSGGAPPMPPGMNSYTKKKTASGSSKHNAVARAAAMAKRSVPMMAAPMSSTSSFSTSSTPVAAFTPVTAQAPKNPVRIGL